MGLALARDFMTKAISDIVVIKRVRKFGTGDTIRAGWHWHDGCGAYPEPCDYAGG